MRIVVIDDSPDDRALAVRALKAEFPEALYLQAARPEEVDHALEVPADLVVTDYALRWTTGIDIIDRVRQHHPATPVIMFTNTGSEEVAAQALRHGAADYVIKRPGKFSRLGNAARGAVTQRQLRARVDALLEQEREARVAAEEASRLREEFLATLSHELRTPLHAILGWVALLARGAVKEADLPRAYEVIERNARMQARLIDDLLDLSRAVSGRLGLNLETLPLDSVVEQVLGEMAPLAAAKGVHLLPVEDDYRGLVHADPARLSQVLRNLLSNAIKFSQPGGKVRVRLHRVRAFVEITVKDEGVGLDRAFMPRLFERFRQADSSTTRRAGGMGIGLSIARYIVEAHGGQIAADSPGPGKGATFCVKLPMPATTAVRDADSPGAPLPRLDGVRVLAVDDEQDGLDLLAQALQASGASVLKASSAEAALDKLREGGASVLVSDIAMPGEDGYVLLHKVRHLRSDISAIPAIALSAFARPEDRDRALVAGFDRHLGKPVDPAVLVRAIAEVLDGVAQCGTRLSGSVG